MYGKQIYSSIFSIEKYQYINSYSTDVQIRVSLVEGNIPSYLLLEVSLVKYSLNRFFSIQLAHGLFSYTNILGHNFTRKGYFNEMSTKRPQAVMMHDKYALSTLSIWLRHHSVISVIRQISELFTCILPVSGIPTHAVRNRSPERFVFCRRTRISFHGRCYISVCK